jgi:hypothetical protein
MPSRWLEPYLIAEVAPSMRAEVQSPGVTEGEIRPGDSHIQFTSFPRAHASHSGQETR